MTLKCSQIKYWYIEDLYKKFSLARESIKLLRESVERLYPWTDGERELRAAIKDYCIANDNRIAALQVIFIKYFDEVREQRTQHKRNVRDPGLEFQVLDFLANVEIIAADLRGKCDFKFRRICQLHQDELEGLTDEEKERRELAEFHKQIEKKIELDKRARMKPIKLPKQGKKLRILGES